MHKLKLSPYKMHVHILRAHDAESRVNFCKWFTAFLAGKGENILDKTFFTDGAWFHLSGYVNSQNLRIWSTDNPYVFHEKPLRDQTVGIWCALV